MKNIEINVESQTASVQPGAVIGDLDVATMKHNLATALGTSTVVGIGGQALDLGMGFLTRSFGFLIDNVIEYGNNCFKKVVRLTFVSCEGNKSWFKSYFYSIIAQANVLRNQS